MKSLNLFYMICAAALISLPIVASAKITCESLEAILDVPDDQCAALSDSARRCFTALNLELNLVKKTTDKELRARAAHELTMDYTREIKNWRGHYAYMTRLGEGRACLNESAEVEVWIEELERDLKVLEKRRF